MAGFSPALPFGMSPGEGIVLTTSLLEVIKQNFKNLVLTNPGERVMLPDFGVGIKRYLFEMNDAVTQSSIQSKIGEQVKKYMPFLSLDNIQFLSTNDMFDAGTVNIRIFYHVSPLEAADVLTLTI